MSRQQKRQQREADIISATIELLNQNSFLDLRMSDIAKAAKCSMGAIYSHFSSKEDLLLGCACKLIREKIALLDKILSNDMEPIEYLLMVNCMMWLLNSTYPQHHQLTQLAMNPSIWRRASVSRSEIMNELGDFMQLDVDSLAFEALEKVSKNQNSQRTIRTFRTGLFGLSMGIYNMKESGFGCFTESLQDEDGIELHLTNLGRYLKGWGFDPDQFNRSLKEIYELADGLVKAELT